MDQVTLNAQKQRYKYLAYVILRDAVAFYFGIPECLKEDNIKQVFYVALKDKLETIKEKKGQPLTQKEVNRCLRLVRRNVNQRLQELEEDLIYCENLLFHDNIWLEHLEVSKDFFKVYLSKLDSDTKRTLAVIPKWGTKDHSLGRPYINDNFNLLGFK